MVTANSPVQGQASKSCPAIYGMDQPSENTLRQLPNITGGGQSFKQHCLSVSCFYLACSMLAQPIATFKISLKLTMFFYFFS